MGKTNKNWRGRIKPCRYRLATYFTVVTIAIDVALTANAYPYKTWNGGDADNYWESAGNWYSADTGHSQYNNGFIIGDVSNVSKKTVVFGSAVDAGNVPLFIEGPNIARDENDPIVFIADQDDYGLMIGNLSVGDNWGYPYLAIEKGSYSFSITTIKNIGGDNDTVAFRIGGGGYNAIVTVRDEMRIRKDKVKVAAGGALVVNSFLCVGYDGNMCTLLVDGGAVTNTATYASIGDDANSPGVMTLENGGIYANSGTGWDDGNGGLVVGMRSAGTLNVDGGEVSLATPINVCYYSGSSAAINITNGGVVRTAGFRMFNGTSIMTIDGGTLKAAANDVTFIPDSANLTLTVGAGGAAIDTDGNAVTVAKAIEDKSGEAGKVKFSGGGKVTLSGANTYTGGTTINIGTRVDASVETAKDTILSNLTINGSSYYVDANDIVVFKYTAGELPDTATNNVAVVNCGEETVVKFSDDRKSILVDFKARPWATVSSNTTWSALLAEHNGVAPRADEIVCIRMTGDYTLTIDTDVDVAGLAFSNGSGSTLSVVSSKTLAVADIIGISRIANNGMLVKNGSGTASWSFDNASIGTTIVSDGTLKVTGKTGSGTSHTIRVKSGATFDANGVIDSNVNVILEGGATFANTGGDIGDNISQAVRITLDGDATAVFSRDFGILAPGYGATRLELGSNTFTINGACKYFWLCNTMITGDGTIDVSHGWLTCIGGKNSTGADCTLNIGFGGGLRIYDGCVLSVKNFVNGGTMHNDSGTLQVTGTLTPGNSVNNLTLADGATVKATGIAQMVSTTFSASGTITIDASAISEVAISAGDAAVLTVPSSYIASSAVWAVNGAAIEGTRAKWVDDDGGTTKTLYLVKPIGLMIMYK